MALILEVESNEQGRITIPARVREILHVEGKAHWQMEVRDDEVILRPAVIVPREDAWAHTPEHLALVESALADLRAGRTRTLSPAELDAAIEGEP